MRSEFFKEAFDIITTNGQITVSFNTPVENHCSHTYHILIHKSNASVIKKLVEAGFAVSMTEKGLSVDKF